MCNHSLIKICKDNTCNRQKKKVKCLDLTLRRDNTSTTEQFVLDSTIERVRS